MKSKKNFRNSEVYGILVVVLLGLGLAGIFVSAGDAAYMVFQETPAPPSEEELEAAAYRQMLAQEDLGDALRSSLEEKLAMAELILAQRQAAAANWEVRGLAEIPTPAPAAQKTFAEGIFSGGEGLFSPAEAVMNNYWQMQQGEEYVQVFAGVRGDESGQGLLAVVTTASDRMTTRFEMIPAPDESGSLTILDEQNQVLILAAQDGTQYCFDVETRKFVCAVR